MSSPRTPPHDETTPSSTSPRDDESTSSTDDATAIRRFANAIRTLATVASRPPPSPSSSLKACFVQSRPTSANYSDYYDSSSDGEEFGDLRRPGRHHFATAWLATENWTRSQVRARTPSQDDNEARSVFAASAHSRHSIIPMRIVRRVDLEPEHKAINMETMTESTRRHTWPAVKRIRKKVSSILSRKGKGAAFDDEGATSSSFIRPVIQRAFSLHSPDATGDRVQRATRTTIQRSRSFAEFTSALGAIEDVEGDDWDLDDITAEARGVVEGIRSRWVFEEV